MAITIGDDAGTPNGALSKDAAAVYATGVIDLAIPTRVPEPRDGAKRLADDLLFVTGAFVAQVASTTSRFEGAPVPEHIVSDFIVQPIELMKGEALTKVTVPGGTIGDVAFGVSHAPILKTGSTYLIMYQVEHNQSVIVAAAFHIGTDESFYYDGNLLTLDAARAALSSSAGSVN